MRLSAGTAMAGRKVRRPFGGPGWLRVATTEPALMFACYAERPGCLLESNSVSLPVPASRFLSEGVGCALGLVGNRPPG